MDKTALPEQLKTLRQRYGIEHCPVVGSQLNRLGRILHSLEARERLTHQDIEWLKNRSLLSIKILYSYYTIEIAFAENEGQHEKDNIRKYESLLEDCRKAMEFDEVKSKYGIVCKQGVMNSVIYPLLSKIDSNIPLSPQERKKLKKRELSLEQIMMGYLLSTAQYYRREYENTKKEGSSGKSVPGVAERTWT